MNVTSVLRIAAIVLAASVLSTLLNSGQRGPAPVTVPYSDFLAAIRDADVERVSAQGPRLVGTRRSGEPFTTYAPDDPGLIGDLLDAGVAIESRPETQPSLLAGALVSLLPILLLIGVFVLLMRRQMGGRAG